MSIYDLPVIIINNVLGYNSQLIHKHDWENSTTTNMMSHIVTYEIGQDRSKIVKSEINTVISLNSRGLQTLIGL